MAESLRLSEMHPSVCFERLRLDGDNGADPEVSLNSTGKAEPFRTLRGKAVRQKAGAGLPSFHEFPTLRIDVHWPSQQSERIFYVQSLAHIEGLARLYADQ